MSRLDRLKEYANPEHGPHGAASDKANIKFWQDVASENSADQTTRASDGPMKLHDTGKKVATRDTAMQPKVSRSVDAAMAGKGDLNHVGGSDYMKSVRRDA